MPRVRVQFKDTHKRSDAKGNMLILSQEPVFGNKKLHIQLAGEMRRRLIGEIDTQNRTMFVRRNKEKHLHHKLNSYGFNWHVINEATSFTNVLMLVQSGGKNNYYMIPTQFIKENGSVKNFSASGFELQTFLRIEFLERFTTDKKFIKGKITP